MNTATRSKAGKRVGPKVTTLAPWFGSNRILAEHVGRALAGCEWVGVPFAGGMCELAHIEARTLNVNDLHKHVINLARVVAHPIDGAKLIRRLRRVLFHPATLENAQQLCATGLPTGEDREARIAFAAAYFVTAWMSRNGTAGTKKEFDAGQSIRWESGGGDSAIRFRSATESLRDWRRILARATFTSNDAFEFLAKCKDRPGHGIYVDPPFPGPGAAYKHTFDESGHWRLARMLRSFEAARIVCRFYDVPLIHKLYSDADGWAWTRLEGRKQTNDVAPEVLLVRNAAEGGVE